MQAHIDRKADPSKRAKSVWLFAGFLAYVGVGYVYLVSGLMFVPGRWLAPLWGGWFVGLWFAYRLLRSRSQWVVASAPVALVILWAYVEAGWALWGWAVEDLPFGLR
jgi:hypothetical protein